jgi:hypothetical protein
MQQALVYILLSGAVAYVCRLLYLRVKKQEACDKCELMKAAKLKK